jgi:2,4-dienoyl-CoA reductase-like NADH-dependent reductase (Old Yellow Enzyme family)
VREDSVEEFTDRLAGQSARLCVGNGMDAGTQIGPLISGAAVEAARGHFLAPLVLGGVDPDAAILREEVFAPVAPAVAFRDEDEAIRMANDTDMGLASYVYSAGLARALRIGEALEMSPLDLGFATLPNRALMGSMHLRLEEAEQGFERMAVFYAARARGGAGLIVTGGFAPDERGRSAPEAAKLTTPAEAERHTLVTEAVHRAGGRIALQILHHGRYARHPDLVAPSAIRSPISARLPHELTGDEVEETIEAFARAAGLAKAAGYDGVEILGSEGYLVNEFTAPATSHRTDRWGGTPGNRMRFPAEIVRRVRERAGAGFILIYRLSMLDLVPGGSALEEVVALAQAIEAAGATIINTGIGWHEARVPTIATSVPRGAYTWVTRALRGSVSVPLVTGNRINTPEVAEQVLAEGRADMVSMARPFLADPDFVAKAQAGRAHAIKPRPAAASTWPSSVPVPPGSPCRSLPPDAATP